MDSAFNLGLYAPRVEWLVSTILESYAHNEQET